MPGSNIHFHQSGFEYRLKRKPTNKSTRPKTLRQRPGATKPSFQLLDFDRRAGVDELLLNGRRLFLADAFLDRLGGAIDQILGFLQAEAGYFAYCLDNIDLVRAVRQTF